MQDGEFIAIMCIFAVSNGYLGTISMIHGPKTVEDSKSQEGVAMMLAACLVIGIAAGSLLSYPQQHTDSHLDMYTQAQT